MALVSIIVPVYNAQTTIQKCTQSIMAQDYLNIEIILVDDGSTDDSASLMDTLAKKDDRIQVIHTENNGVSAARNTGIARAKGDYIGFVDADDWIEAGMYRHLVNLIEQESADIAICGYFLEFKNEKNASPMTQSVYPTRQVLSGDEAYAAALKPDRFKGYLVNKLFRSHFFSQEGHRIRLDETLHICEDMLCVNECLRQSQRIVYDAVPLYHYVISDNNTTNASFSLRKATLIDASRKIADLTHEYYPALAGETEKIYLSNIAYIFLLSLHERSDFKLPNKDVKRVRKHLFSYIFGKGYIGKYKFLLIGLSISQQAVKALYRLCRKRRISQ